MDTSACVVVKERALFSKPAPTVNREILTKFWVSFAAFIVLARKAVTGRCCVELVAPGSVLTVPVLVELTDGGHSEL